MKTDWFAQARSVFGRRTAPPPPQPFAVPCNCGALLQGERTDALQKPKCPQCGQTVFVLPECVYPIPESVRQRWAGEEVTAPEPAPKQKPRKTVVKGDEPRGSATKPPRPPGIPWSERQRQLTTSLRSQITPLRLIALAVCALVGLMTLVLARQARWSHAQAAVQPAIDAGYAALEERDFAVAAKSFTEAAAALDVLGRRDDVARTVRRLSREVAVCDQLSSESLLDLLDELHTKTDGADVAERFARQYAGRWILFDAPLFAELGREGKRSRAVRIDLPLLVREAPVEILIDGSPWPALLSGSTASSPRRVLFAAQLDRFEPATKERPTGRVWLNGATAVLWTESQTLAALEFLPTEAEQLAVVDSLLAAQRDLVEVDE